MKNEVPNSYLTKPLTSDYRLVVGPKDRGRYEVWRVNDQWDGVSVTETMPGIYWVGTFEADTVKRMFPRPDEVTVGDVVQLDPSQHTHHDGFWAANFLVVTEVKDWGVQGYCKANGCNGTPGGLAYYRAKKGTYVKVGSVEWMIESAPKPKPEPKNWGVWCTVSGGVTGHREFWAKENNVLWRGTEAEAQAYATKLRDSRHDYHGPATFSYGARLLGEAEDAEAS